MPREIDIRDIDLRDEPPHKIDLRDAPRREIDLRDERGSALVEAPAAIAIVLLLVMGFLTLVQAAWTHHQLADAVRDGSRYATRADWDPESAFTGSRRRTEDEVRAW